ncbi:hypothetical protein DVH24_033843 [Malus domestica]|uniref:Uncharacterized protein n=1 Tax=Malus domestica TaxID=3750 RepID=A0A498HRQ2_MALDO|nr:hypothetical protein DVH24_033843 [Malus domestica]
MMSLSHMTKSLIRFVNWLKEPAMPLGEDDMEADWSKPIVRMRYLSMPFHFCFSILKCLTFLSLGCKAIFLLGGKHREDPPTAMFLRSGDAVLMARKRGNAFMVNANLHIFLSYLTICHNTWCGCDFLEYCFYSHMIRALLSCVAGVPRVFTDGENAEIVPLEKQFSDEEDVLCFRVHPNFKNQHQHQTSILSFLNSFSLNFRFRKEFLAIQNCRRWCYTLFLPCFKNY